jgi:hypothetical protein
MPVRSSTGSTAPVASAFPKLQRGPSGSIWLMASEKVGTLLHKGSRAVENIGYHSTKLSQRKLADYTGEVKLA